MRLHLELPELGEGCSPFRVEILKGESLHLIGPRLVVRVALKHAKPTPTDDQYKPSTVSQTLQFGMNVTDVTIAMNGGHVAVHFKVTTESGTSVLSSSEPSWLDCF